jgi:endonuclease YncB( thermonuclease family)
MATGWIWPVARVVEVHDGDTLKLAVSLGFDVWAHPWVRLANVRAPELTEPDGPAARNDVLDWLREHAPDSQVAVTTQKVDRPLEIRFRQSFTRYLGTVTAPNGAELNRYLIDKGYIDRGMAT